MDLKNTDNYRETGVKAGGPAVMETGTVQPLEDRGPSTPRRLARCNGGGHPGSAVRLGNNVIFLTSLALAVTASFAFFAGLAEAGRLKASVYIVQAKIPNKLTERGLIGFARSHNTKRLRETNEPKLDDRSWQANLVVAFNQPPGDLEFQVLFYDIHDGPRRLVEDLSTFVNDRSQKTYLQKFKLERPRFKPNRNMELVVVVRRQEVARMKFGVLGQAVRRSGTVDFSDEEAKL
jgi:hypothetical protein